MPGAMHLWCGDTLVAHCIFGMVILWYTASLVHLWCIFSALYLWLDASLVWWFLGMQHFWCASSLVWCIYAAMHLWWAAYMMWCIYGVQYFFGVLHHWCVASWCYVYMHFWYAINRHLWWCLIGAITIVQCIFGALFFGLGCNIFLVLRLWCYALSAISRRLATAVAHLLYVDV